MSNRSADIQHTSPSSTIYFKNGKIKTFELTPEAGGVKRWEAAALKGGEAAHNAEALRSVLRGETSAFRDAAVMTAAAALLMAERVKDFRSGVREAEAAIDA